MNWTVGLIICVALPLLKGEIYRYSDWRDVTPVIQSEVQRLGIPEMKTLLDRYVECQARAFP